MIYITGDTHGRIDRICGNEALSALGEGDHLIVCGDFGFVFETRGTMSFFAEYEDILRIEALCRIPCCSLTEITKISID